jgi:aspartate--ammonia ligase
MYSLDIPQGYSSKMSLRDNEKAVKLIKDTFEDTLAAALNLDRVTAPLIVEAGNGVNDDLNGTERKVSFDIKQTGTEAEVVQSLAKWKRLALARYGFQPSQGLYTDMNAIRRDDDMDNLHSIFVDQWDWEKVITRGDRNCDYLKDTVKKIVDAVCDASEKVNAAFPENDVHLSRDVFFITSQQLEDMYPDDDPRTRENKIVREHKTVFIMQIGGVLRSGKKHDGRAPDYDDWNLNGDIFFWHETLGCALEVSSMGIRVDETSIVSQLRACGNEDRMKFMYHASVAQGILPLTIGGGIGQSRLCMLLLGKAHIGEVQVSVWPAEMLEKCAEHKIMIL